uniref:RPGRIP1 like n=1 Tax=Fundulus heteroclitus TaxID=8078 RepID=A0A3Q2QWB5_FUNHE
MSYVLDETATDLPVRDMTVNLSRLTDRQNVGKLSREELEDRFLRVHEETLQLKQHAHKQDEKIKKLGTKLMKLVKDRGRMQQLAAGVAQPLSRFRDVEMEEMNVVESQQSRVEELEGVSEQLREELRRKEEEFEEKLLQARQQQTSTLRSHVSSNTSMIKLQKQLAERSNTVTELEGRYRLLQEAQRTLKASNDAAMVKLGELTAQLKDERTKNLELDRKLRTVDVTKIQVEQLQERVSDLEQERDLLKESNEKLMNSAFDGSLQQKWQLQEQQLKLQIAQLETALKADLMDKNEILDKIKWEREKYERLTEENQKLQIQFLEQKQQVEELNEMLKFYGREKDYGPAELTEALLLIKRRKSQKSGDLSFLVPVDEDGSGGTESSVKELRAAHAETIQELEKTRNLLNMESRISKDYKAELEAALRKMSSDKVEFEQRLERQAQLLDARAAKITKLEGQLRDIAYGTKPYVFKPDLTGEDEAESPDEAVDLQRGENLLELQIVGASLSPPALQVVGDGEPSTFCTYAFYLFETHSTPVATGRSPTYGFTSKYVVSMDEHFMDYLHRYATFFCIKIEARSFGSLDYWLRLRIPMTETLRLYREKLKAVGYIQTALSESSQVPLRHIAAAGAINGSFSTFAPDVQSVFLAQRGSVCSSSSGVFELADPSGRPAGCLEVTLSWKFAYCRSAAVGAAAEGPGLFSAHHVGELVDPNQEPADAEAEKTDRRLENVEEMLQEEMENKTCSGPQLSERVRVEVVSLSLTPQSRLALDDSVVRLFVEYNFLDLPTEETPLSLPKPPQGRLINFNYSKALGLDKNIYDCDLFFKHKVKKMSVSFMDLGSFVSCESPVIIVTSEVNYLFALAFST